MEINLLALGTCILMCAGASSGYSQTICDDADPLYASSTYNYTQYTTSDNYYWFKFTATSPYISISLETAKFGLDVPHIHTLKLFSGLCDNLTQIAEDELPFYSEAKYLSINLNASNLQIGQDYFIRVDRLSDDHECTKGNCKANNSTDPSTFTIAVKEIFLVLPPDMMIEPPVSGWGLQTNRGQLLDDEGNVAQDVVMYNDRSNPGVFLCDDHVSYVYTGEDSGEEFLQRVDMVFENANPNYEIFKTEELPGFINYYMPHIPDGVTKSRTYSRAVINDLYRKIDFHQYSNTFGLKNYFIVYPGAKPSDIRMLYQGADSVTVDSLNHLYIKVQMGTLEFERPHVYTIDSTGFPQSIICNTTYEKLDEFTVGFNIQGYSGTEPLIIVMDQGHSAEAPKSIANLLWSTYYGSTSQDYFNDIDHDQNGNVYFTGYTYGLFFPHTITSVYSASSNYPRVVVGKHKPLGERSWCTIYGAQQDAGNGIAVDNSGNVYVAGESGVYSEPNQFLDVARSGAFNMAPSSLTLTATYATVYRFNQSNGACTWATLFGEHTNNALFIANSVATDNSGNVYIGGRAKRISSSPLLATSVQYSQSTTGTNVGFIAKFNAANALTWSTMFGNDNLTVNEMNTGFNPQTNQNELFVVGTTSGTNATSFPMTKELPNDYQANYRGGASDAFFAKFNSSDKLVWSSFFGGAGDDLGYGIDYGYGNTSLLITGQTKSDASTFPLHTIPTPQSHYNGTLNGASDGFLAEMQFIGETTGGHTLRYSSYFGGSSDDKCGKVQISDAGNVYVIGVSKSPNFPVQDHVGNYDQDVLENDVTGLHYDAFVLGLSSVLSYGWGTFFGGEWYYNGSNANANSDDLGNGITVFNDEILYIGGTTSSQQNFPITVDLTQSPNAYIQYENSGMPNDIPDGYQDGFLAQFDLTGVVLGLEELNTDNTNGNLTVYPNPTSGNFSIIGSDLQFNGKVTIEVLNVLGQRIFSKSSVISDGKLSESVSLSNMSDGVYIVNIGNGNQKITRRVVVR